MTRIAVLAEVHGNLAALEAVMASVARSDIDLLFLAGGLVLDGPEPAASLDLSRELEEDGALVVCGMSDTAVADFDFARFRSLDGPTLEGVRAAAEWAHEALGPERVDWIRRLPSERRIWVDDTLVMWCQGSPGSRHLGLDDRTDEGVAAASLGRTDARVVACAYTHLPSVRCIGEQLVVNAGSVGYPQDGRPLASWASIDIRDGSVQAEIHRVPYGHLDVADSVAGRGLPGDATRARSFATGRTD